MLLFCSIFPRFVKISCYHSMGDTSNEYIMHLSGIQPAIRVLRVNWRVPFQWVLNRYGSNIFSPQKNMELNKMDLPRTIVIFLRFIPITSMYGVFTYIWLFIMVNTGEYTVHGSYGPMGFKMAPKRPFRPVRGVYQYYIWYWWDKQCVSIRHAIKYVYFIVSIISARSFCVTHPKATCNCKYWWFAKKWSTSDS